MAGLRRLTAPTVDVLRALCAVSAPLWGLQLVKETARSPGTIYPILGRLEACGWVIARWETDEDRTGPRRRYYELTDTGRLEAKAAIRHFEGRRERSRPSSRTAAAQ